MPRTATRIALSGITVSHLHGRAALAAGSGDFKTFKPACPGAGRIRRVWI